MARETSPISSETPDRAEPDANLCLRRVVLRLDDLFTRAERRHLRLQALLSLRQLFLLYLKVGNLRVQALEFHQRGLLALQRESREVFSPCRHRLPRLSVELDDAVFHLRRLKFETALGGNHLHHAAL